MPRKPLGTYTRDTASWYQHKRAKIGGLAILATANPVSIGLKNNDQGGRVCHVLGVTIATYQVQPLLEFPFLTGDYYSTPGTPLGGGDVFEFSEVQPFFDLDPVPMVSLDCWYNGNEFPGSATLIPDAPIMFSPVAMGANQQAAAAVTHYPPGGLAAFKPGRGFYILWPLGDQDSFGVMFDFVMLPD
jgi:hypothetical protein